MDDTRTTGPSRGQVRAPRSFRGNGKARFDRCHTSGSTAIAPAIGGLSQSQLDTHYKNWTIRQITHHLADSHLHSIIRFKWALTEEHPTIKAYEEGDWVQLADSQHGDIEPALHLLEGLHAKWVQLLESMNEARFPRTFFHPQTETSVNLWMALNSYAWHGRHHTAQIRWLRDRHGW